MPEPLTELERRILDYLIQYLRRHTYQPSIREIGRQFEIKSTKTVSEHLTALAEKGWIERDPSRSRGVRLVTCNLQPGTTTVPFYGDAVPDGVTLEREGVVEEYDIDRKLVGPSGTFLLSMKGDSMRGMGIHHGDLLMIEPVPPDMLESGDVIVARYGGETTIIRYFERDEDVVLDPAAADVPPTLVRDRDTFSAMGRVVGVFRRLRPVRRAVPEPTTEQPAAETATAERPTSADA